MKKYPIKYYLVLILAFILTILLWFILFKDLKYQANSVVNTQLTQPIVPIRNIPVTPVARGNNSSRIPPGLIEYKPIENPEIIEDEHSRRQIVANIVNIAIKDSINRVPGFITRFNSEFISNDYSISYVDTLINYIQVNVPQSERVNFKQAIKAKLNQYDLLVWDETIFKSNSTETAIKPNWHLDITNLSDVNNSLNSNSVSIAIIDNGFDLSHPSLNQKKPLSFNATDGSKNVSPSAKNHGTHVASIALGDNVNDIIGVCPGCNIMPIKVEDKNGLLSSNYIIKGILFAIKNNADVINLSLGSNIVSTNNIPINYQEYFISKGAKEEETFWKELFKYASDQNSICVLAAGNNNILTGFDPFQRAHQTIKVGAIDANYKKTDFSNYGRNTTIYAPGENIFGAKPNEGYEPLSGTSMAAPIVAGFIGLLKSVDKNRDIKDIKDLLAVNSEMRNGLRILNFKTLN